MIWKTREGYEYSKVQNVWGKFVHAWSDECREMYEARAILEKPREERMAFIRSIAAARAKSDLNGQKAIVERLEANVTAEWKWQRAQREKEDAA